jgi:hypothetical protein
VNSGAVWLVGVRTRRVREEVVDLNFKRRVVQAAYRPDAVASKENREVVRDFN